MGFETIVTQQSGPSFVVTLNQPHRRNAVDLKMMEEIIAAALEAEAESTVRALIITGGKDYFSAEPISTTRWWSSRRPPVRITSAAGISSTRRWRN